MNHIPDFDNTKQSGRPDAALRIAALNLGCKTNRYETDAVLADFARRGYQVVSFEENADVYVINTCSVTGEAGRKSGQMVRRARKHNPAAVVVAMGCHVELGAETLGADILVGNQGKTQVPQLVEEWFQDGNRQGRIDIRLSAGQLNLEKEPVFEEFSPQGFQSESRGILKIQDGCNNFCSYCAIPLARGRVRSREEESILAEAVNLASAGYSELVLTGIHICSYGQDRGEDNLALIRLLEKLAEVPGVSRLRLGSVEPKSVTPEFARRLGRIPAVCPHIHLSLQSGAEETLRRMNRRYTAAEYREAVRNLREALPESNLTTDVIVGFPGETHEAHSESLSFCEEIGFGRLHVFRYSAREGTAAARFPDQVDPQTAIQRSEDFQQLASRLHARRQSKLLGREAQVLLETRHPDGSWSGYTEAYDMTSVCFSEKDREEAREGDIWQVMLEEAPDGELNGKTLKRMNKGKFKK